MTVLTSHALTNRFDRVLLRMSSALDRLVALRIEHRGTTAGAAADDRDSARATAQAIAAVGMMPR